MNNSVKILIIDDHRLFSDGIKTMLSDIPHVEITNQINDAREALKEVELMMPDIVLMDYNMPNMNGLEATEYLLEHFSELKIIFLSMHEDSHIIEKIYASGAYGYVSKTATKETFLEAINMVLKGKKYFAKSIVDIVNTSISNKVRLTKREFEIIEKVKSGLTTKQIAETLFISHYTVETHRKNIIIKLGLRGEQELFKYLVKH
jgi:two-component system nitrate/nitrite response regulator NarL